MYEEIILKEIHKTNSEIRNNSDAACHKQGMQLLADTISLIVTYSIIARKEGLLALEEAVYSRKDNDYLRRLVLLVVDGTDPDYTLNLGLFRYMQKREMGFEGLNMLLILSGILMIQSDENPILIREQLLCMVPEEIENLLDLPQESDLLDGIGPYNKNTLTQIEIVYLFEASGIMVEA